MKKIFANNVFKNYLLMLLTIFSCEVIFRLVLNMPVLDWALLRIFLGANIISILFGTLYSFLGRVAGNILTFITCLGVSIYALVQAGFENYLGVYISINSAAQSQAVTSYLLDYLRSFKNEFYLILIPVGLLLLYYIFLERKISKFIKNSKYNVLENIGGKKAKDDEKIRIHEKEKKIYRITRVALIMVTIITGCIYYYSLSAGFMQNKIQLVSTKELFVNPSMPNIAVNQFGISTFGLLDVKLSIIKNNETSNGSEGSYTKPEQEITDYTRYIDDSIWEELIKNEKNYNYKKLHNYYISKNITPKNDYSGMFEGKNLVVVMLESVNTMFINEELFPNIYKLYNEGWSWDNAYSPRNACSTGNNEMSGMTSLFTINRTCTANYYKDNKYFNSIFNLFNRAGYTTSSYHDYTEHYYYRKIIHKNMGSMKYSNVIDLGIPYNEAYEEWPSDVELMEKALERFVHQDHFMAWITAVTSHQPYYISSEFGDKYLDDFKDTKYDIQLKRYLSKLKEVDAAIGTLVNGLKEAGKLDDTVIVIYDDHYPYGLKNDILNTYFDYDVNKNNEVDRTPFIIYNPNIKATKFKEHTSYMNILPTVANLFDLNYDPRFYAGTDLLSEEYKDRVVFADGSWQTPVGFYNAATGKINYFGDKTYTNEEIININKEVMANIKMSNLAITSNYFNYLGNKFSEKNSPLTETHPFKDKVEEQTEENK